MVKKRITRFELITKAKEAALQAVQVFNSPIYLFKAESFCVLMIIAWTYLLHAYYKKNKIDYRYFSIDEKGKKTYLKTKYGAFKKWELQSCLKNKNCPIQDENVINNLEFIIQLRNEIEHQMTTSIDILMSARFQACILNFNLYLVSLFGEKHSLDKYISVSLQLSGINEEQASLLKDSKGLPKNIESYLNDFDNNLTEEQYNSQAFSYRVFFVPKLMNHKNQSDKVIEFVPANSELADSLNKKYVVIKEKERKKYTKKEIIAIVNKKYPKFKELDFVKLWKENDAKNPKYNYGISLPGKKWYWYESWLNFVLSHCKKNQTKYL